LASKRACNQARLCAFMPTALAHQHPELSQQHSHPDTCAHTRTKTATHTRTHTHTHAHTQPYTHPLTALGQVCQRSGQHGQRRRLAAEGLPHSHQTVPHNDHLIQLRRLQGSKAARVGRCSTQHWQKRAKPPGGPSCTGKPRQTSESCKLTTPAKTYHKGMEHSYRTVPLHRSKP